ncbi:hypothetical protein PA598K_07277, partial [Paenibacillus sp. 598K]
ALRRLKGLPAQEHRDRETLPDEDA